MEYPSLDNVFVLNVDGIVESFAVERRTRRTWRMVHLMFLMTSSRGLAPKTRKLFCGLPGVAMRTTACWPTRVAYSSMVWRSFRNRRVCCRRRIDGFVSNECGRLRFFDELMAAAAAIPTGPVALQEKQQKMNREMST